MSEFYPQPLRDTPGSVPDGILIILRGPDIVLKDSRLPLGCEWPQKVASTQFGKIDITSCIMLEIAPEDPLPEGFAAHELRSTVARLPDPEKIAVCRARSLSHWQKQRRYCGTCGKLLQDKSDECARVCECGEIYYPVVTPAVIVAVTDQNNRILLAHNSKFRKSMYSLIAGFVEPGETLEHAVAREVKEEVGIDVKNIRYFASQSWPFPNALMVGFTAEYAGGTVTPDLIEIEAADFYSPDNLPELPSHGSIARRIIDHYLENSHK